MSRSIFNVAAALGLGSFFGLCGCGEGGGDPSAHVRDAQETPGGQSAPSGAPVIVASLAWDVPRAWEAADPGDLSMRKARFVVAGEGELVFFHFGPGQGGDVESNLARWARSVLDAEGRPVEPEIEVIETGGLRTVAAAYSGTYLAGPPGGERTPQDGWALLGAVVENGAEGSVFLRLTGPEEALSGVRDEWRAMLSSVRNAGL